MEGELHGAHAGGLGRQAGGCGRQGACLTSERGGEQVARPVHTAGVGGEDGHIIFRRAGEAVRRFKRGLLRVSHHDGSAKFGAFSIGHTIGRGGSDGSVGAKHEVVVGRGRGGEFTGELRGGGAEHQSGGLCHRSRAGRWDVEGERLPVGGKTPLARVDGRNIVGAAHRLRPGAGGEEEVVGATTHANLEVDTAGYRLGRSERAEDHLHAAVGLVQADLVVAGDEVVVAPVGCLVRDVLPLHDEHAVGGGAFNLVAHLRGIIVGYAADVAHTKVVLGIRVVVVVARRIDVDVARSQLDGSIGVNDKLRHVLVVVLEGEADVDAGNGAG